ncbi:hypothetical protein [Delftia acidovorans]|uniref:hypothetical protein n=1 Tax=Delftia acidovorans TaxID=80866 RepID=UPI0024204095|nr:hypothetical protein [Delftia acidovorans]
MTITLEAIRAAGGIVHSNGNIFFRDISMLQGLAGAAPAAVAGSAMDVTLDEDQAGLLRDMLGDREAYPEAITVRLLVGDGHSGHGLYVAQAEYQDEGAVLLASLPAPALEAPPAVAPQGEYPHEQMDAMALARYKVVPSHASMLWSHAVVAGDGAQQLYVGREVECQNMARKFAGAFLDGAFAFHSMAAAPTAQAAPALEAPAHQCCNSWFLSPPEGRQAVLRDNQWMLADAAYEAGGESSRALEAPAAPGVPAGFALVPIEPTQQMLDAGRWSGAGSVSIQEEWARKEVWSRMLATVTPPPAAYADDLVALVTELVQALRKATPDNDLAGHALDYLKRNGLQESPLRAADTAPQAPAAPWKDHQTARLVNDLRDCAIKYHGAGQLRERIAHIVVPLCDQLKGALAAPAAPAEGEVLVEVIGLTGSGKSAICGEIEILCRALGLDVSWPDGDPEKNMTHAEWTAAIEAYKPRVRIVERNVPRQSNGGPAK